VKAALNACQLTLNSRWHKSIRTTPHHVVFGKAKTIALAKHFGVKSQEEWAVGQMRVGIRAEQELLKDAAALRELDSQLNLEPGAFQAECEKYMRQYWQWDKERIVEAFQDLFDIDWAQRFPDAPEGEAGASNACEDRPDLCFADGPRGIAYVEVDTTDIQLPLKALAEGGAADVTSDVDMQQRPPSVETPSGVYLFCAISDAFAQTRLFCAQIDCFLRKSVVFAQIMFVLRNHNVCAQITLLVRKRCILRKLACIIANASVVCQVICFSHPTSAGAQEWHGDLYSGWDASETPDAYTLANIAALFQAGSERESFREAARRQHKKVQDSTIVLRLATGDPVHVEVGTAVRVMVPKKDKYKTDPPAILGYVVARNLYQLHYVIMVVRTSQPMLIKEAVRRAQFRPVAKTLMPDDWNDIAQVTVDHIAKVCPGTENLQFVLGNSRLKHITFRGALASIRPGVAPFRGAGRHEPCCCATSEECTDAQKCACKRAGRQCSASCHATSFACSLCDSSTFVYNACGFMERAPPLNPQGRGSDPPASTEHLPQPTSAQEALEISQNEDRELRRGDYYSPNLFWASSHAWVVAARYVPPIFV